MAHNMIGERLRNSVRDPWAMLLAGVAGGTVWATGSPPLLAVATAGIMVGTATVVGTFTGRREGSGLRAGTAQRGLIDLFDGHLRSLRALQTSTLHAAVRARVDDALAAADLARPSILQVAAAVDAMDDAIAAARQVSGQTKNGAATIKRTTSRLRVRRTNLYSRLEAAVDEVATVYAGLLELSATAGTVGLGVADADIGAVNDSVTLMQMTFAELEADAAQL